MVDVLVRNVSKETMDLLKQRAAKNGHSLQAELSEILEQAGRDVRSRSALEVLEEFHLKHPHVRKSGGLDSVEIIREWRDRER
jgi:plasmid stability protein